MSHIHFDEGEPNPYGWTSVLVTHQGATDPQVMRDTITERYKGDHIRWRSEPEAHEEKLFESLEPRFWCAARLSVKKSEKVEQMSVTKHTIEVLLQKANLDLSRAQIRVFEEQFTPLAEEWLKEHGMVPFTLTEAWLKGFVAAYRCQAEDAIEYVLATINLELKEKIQELRDECLERATRNAELVAVVEALEHRLGDPE